MRKSEFLLKNHASYSNRGRKGGRPGGWLGVCLADKLSHSLMVIYGMLLKDQVAFAQQICNKHFTLYKVNRFFFSDNLWLENAKVWFSVSFKTTSDFRDFFFLYVCLLLKTKWIPTVTEKIVQNIWDCLPIGKWIKEEILQKDNFLVSKQKR